MELFLFGIDGLSQWVLRDYAAQLPNFTRLRAEGNCALCPSPNPVTWECWTTIITGLLPCHHRIRECTQPGAHGLLSRDDASYKYTLWGELSRVGKSVGITGFPPMTYPVVEPRAGWMQSGALNYPVEIAPAGLVPYLDAKPIENYWEAGVRLTRPDAPYPDVLEETNATALRLADYRSYAWNNLQYALQTSPVDAVLHYQHDLDFLQHILLGNDLDGVLQGYRWYDDRLGEVMEQAECVVVCSDHGLRHLRWPDASGWVNSTDDLRYRVNGRGELWDYTSAEHDYWATFICWGAGVECSPYPQVTDMRLEDVMPTVLELLQVSSPPGIDGCARLDVLGRDDGGYAGCSESRRDPMGGELKSVSARLADLGYVDAPPGVA